MNHQPSFSQAEYADKRKLTRREQFLTRLAALIPWPKLLAVIEPFYPKGERGRPPIGWERMVRVYCLQQWYGLADEALEDALEDRRAKQGFARIDLAAEGVPAAATLGSHRAVLFNDREGSLEIFQPYALPGNDWLEDVAGQLAVK